MNLIRKRTVVLGTALAVAGVTMLGATAASACPLDPAHEGEWEYGALYSDGAAAYTLFEWKDAEDVADGQGDTVKQKYSLYDVFKAAKFCPVNSSMGVGPSSAAAFDGELAMYTWASDGIVYRIDNDGSVKKLGKGGTKAGSRTASCIRWGGDVNPLTGEIFQTGDYTEYVKYNGTTNHEIMVLVPTETSATLQAVSSKTITPEGLDIRAYELAESGKKYDTWYVGSDAAFDAAGELYEVWTAKGYKDGARWVVHYNVPRLADGSVDPNGQWTYDVVVRLGVFPEQITCSLYALWGLAVIGDHIYLGYEGGKIYRADMATGEIAYFGKAECGLQDLATGGDLPFEPEASIVAYMNPSYPDYWVQATFVNPDDGTPVKGVKCTWRASADGISFHNETTKSDAEGHCTADVVMDEPGTYMAIVDWKRGRYTGVVADVIGQGTPPRP
ncbi:MAG: hypothetical protein LBR27_00005 [Bifidobacteriaceae bacterium]|jgi:hypothetical protein|nr:hypothetical protein [Bifidobacteriaceae bacterium]